MHTHIVSITQEYVHQLNMIKVVGLWIVFVVRAWEYNIITGVSLINGTLCVQACGFDTCDNNKNTTIVQYTQYALVVFRASLYCICKTGHSISGIRVSMSKKKQASLCKACEWAVVQRDWRAENAARDKDAEVQVD